MLTAKSGIHYGETKNHTCRLRLSAQDTQDPASRSPLGPAIMGTPIDALPVATPVITVRSPYDRVDPFLPDQFFYDNHP